MIPETKSKTGEVISTSNPNQIIEFNPTIKQAFAYLRLVDSFTREIGYGGSA